MLKGLTRLVAVAVAVLPALVNPAPVAASGTGTLFAIAGNQQLVSIDRSTGAFTLLTDLNTPDQPQSSSLASDPVVHRLYLIRLSVTFGQGGPVFNQQLLTVNSRSGAIVAQVAYNGPEPALMVDPASGELLAFDSLNRLLQVNPATGATKLIATVTQASGCGTNSVAIDAADQTVYFAQENCDPIETAATQLFTINYVTGAVAVGPVLDRPVRQIAFDSGTLYGVTDCCTQDYVRIDKATGATTFLSTLGDGGNLIQFGTATDAATQTTFIDVETFDFQTGNVSDNLVEMDDRSGTPTTVPLATGVAGIGMAFEAAITITFASTKSDITSGGVDNSGVVTSLISLLNSAVAAQTQGQCGTATNQLQAFSNLVKAQSGQHIAAATASQLLTDARALGASCP